MSKTALIVVDLQGDFIGGSLAVPDATAVYGPILDAAKLVDLVVFTADRHPADHCSFSAKPEYRDGSWPEHCVYGTAGSEIATEVFSQYPHSRIFTKGKDPNVEEYSGFDGDNNGEKLADYLREQDVDKVVVAGLATDYCVHATARDASLEDFFTVVLSDGVRGVNPVTTVQAVYDLTCDFEVAFTESSNLDIFLSN